MKDISPILQSLGLLDSEIKTYLAALENGPGTVVELTKTTHLSRQATYVAIETLSGRGLMSNALRGKKRLYAAEPPGKLLTYAKRKDVETHERVKDLEAMIPELELRTGGERPVVRMFQGKEGVMEIVQDMLHNNGEESFEMTDLDAMYNVLSPDDLQAMRNEVKKAGVKIRGLYWGTVRGQNVPLERIFLPKRYSDFKTNIGVYGNRVALVTFEGKMHSVIIESETLAKAMRLLFNLALKGAKEQA